MSVGRHDETVSLVKVKTIIYMYNNMHLSMCIIVFFTMLWQVQPKSTQNELYVEKMRWKKNTVSKFI